MTVSSRGSASRPATMLHHVKEIQLRLLATVLVLIAGMIVGYYFYEHLFQFIKSPLDGPLHYTSPAGSFSFVIKICLMVGVIAMLPVAVYNSIMFVQPALKERLSLLRVYITTFLSLVFAVGGAAFAFFVIIPMALEFFFKFQVTGLEALISADDYLQFVINVIITFVVIFQLPLIISIIDFIRPIPPKKLLKAEKFIIVGSVAIGVLVPFALDPFIQLLIASPIILLYNLSIIVVLIQHRMGRRKKRGESESMQVKEVAPVGVTATAALQTAPRVVDAPKQKSTPSLQASVRKPVHRHMDMHPGAISRSRTSTQPSLRRTQSVRRPAPTRSLISDMRPARPSPTLHAEYENAN